MSSPLSVPTTPIGYASDSSSGWWAATEDEATPELRWPLSVGVYDRMRRQDAQVASVLRAVTLPPDASQAQYESARAFVAGAAGFDMSARQEIAPEVVAAAVRLTREGEL